MAELATTPFRSLLLYLFVAAAAGLSVYCQHPPPAVSADAPPQEFSSGRALQHIKAVSVGTHPSGSPGHAAVREYILGSLRGAGLSPEIQATTVTRRLRTRTAAASVQNISARLRGTQSGRAVLLVAHYDSVPNSYGASDDGSGVGVLLETLRAVRAGPPLKNDVIFLFTDCEEYGLLGAKAYADEVAQTQNIGLVINFDARGTSGPAFMFQTGERNGRIIGEFADAVSHPFASSLMNTIYKLLPNETDFTAFDRAGLPGLNFAFIGGTSRYHTLRDSLDYMDERSVQHEGASALGLTRHFGNLNLDDIKAADAVYFDVLGTALVRYPRAAVLPLTAVVFLALAVVLVLGRRNRKVTLKGTLAGFFLFFFSLVLSVALAALVSFVGGRVAGRYNSFSNAGLYMIGYAALAVAAVALLINLFGRRVGFGNLGAGALILWLALAVLTGVLLPGVSYLFMWPLLFGVGALALATATKGAPTPLRLALLCVCALPGLVLISSTVSNLVLGVGVGLLPITLVPVVLLVGLLIPHLGLMPARWRRALPVFAITVSLVFLVVAHLTPSFDRGRPKTDTLFYSLDTDSGQAVWLSPDPQPDEWTSQFFAAGGEKVKAPNHFPNSDGPLMVASAAALNLEADKIEVLSDEVSGDTRTLRLRVTSPRKARVLSLSAEPGTEILSAAVNGKAVETGQALLRDGTTGVWELNYVAFPEEGIELSLAVRPSRPLVIRIVSQSDGLPQAPFSYKPRPDYLLPSGFGDTTRVTKVFNLAT